MIEAIHELCRLLSDHPADIVGQQRRIAVEIPAARARLAMLLGNEFDEAELQTLADLIRR